MIQIKLQMIRGYTIEFGNYILIKHNAKNPSFSLEVEVEIQVILEKILHKIIIRKTSHEPTEFFPSIFIVKKPEEGTQLTLNLTELKKFVKYEHFKMDGKYGYINMVTIKCFMNAIDFKNAYYYVSLSRLFQKL